MRFAEKQAQFCLFDGERIPKPPHYDPTRDSFVCDWCHFSQPKYTRHFIIGKHYSTNPRDRPHGLGKDTDAGPTPPPMPRPEPPPIAKPDENELAVDKYVKSKDAPLAKRYGPHGCTTRTHPGLSQAMQELCSSYAPEQAMPRRKKRWQRIMKRWQHFILLVTKSKGPIVKKQLDKYCIALKSYRSDLAQLTKREKFLQHMQEPAN
jgi:hypothetical protein